MSTSKPRRVSATQSVLVASLLSLAATAPAFAGECPKDKIGGNPLQGAATAPVGVAEMELASIDLGNEEGETEARRKLWLNVEAFPRAKFVAATVKSLGPGRFEASGPLTIKGVTHNIVAPFTMSEAAGVRLVEGQFPLKRLQFKVGEGPWSDTDAVADEVLVRFRFSLPTR